MEEKRMEILNLFFLLIPWKMRHVKWVESTFPGLRPQQRCYFFPSSSALSFSHRHRCLYRATISQSRSALTFPFSLGSANSDELSFLLPGDRCRRWWCFGEVNSNWQNKVTISSPSTVHLLSTSLAIIDDGRWEWAICWFTRDQLSTRLSFHWATLQWWDVDGKQQTESEERRRNGYKWCVERNHKTAIRWGNLLSQMSEKLTRWASSVVGLIDRVTEGGKMSRTPKKLITSTFNLKFFLSLVKLWEN